MPPSDLAAFFSASALAFGTDNTPAPCMILLKSVGAAPFVVWNSANPIPSATSLFSEFGIFYCKPYYYIKAV